MNESMDAAEEDKFWTPRGLLLRSLHELLLSLNIACAFGYAACLYIARSFVGDTQQNDSAYYFLRGAVRVSDLLRHPAVNPVVVDAVARRDSILWSSGTIALTVLVTIWSAAAIIFLLVKLLAPRSDFLFRRIAGPIALFNAPAFCVLTWRITSDWEWEFSGVRTPFGHNVLLWILCGELICFLIISWLGHKRRFFGRAFAALLPLHFAFWAIILFPKFIFYIGALMARLLIHIIAWLIPSAGAAFLLYLWPGARDEIAPGHTIGKWPPIAAATGITILLLIWLPARRHDPIPVNDRSTIVEVSRGPCFGPCPLYTVTIHGNGDVEFDGRQGVKIQGKQNGQITDAQFAKIVSVLNNARFYDLDDRAFSWCFDTPSVSVAITTSGRQKRVSSDSFCSGSKTGVQGNFVRASDEIENIAGADRWTTCDGHRCR